MVSGYMLPQRVMIIGGPGSGKSTFAQALGERWRLPVIHLDALYWTENWKAQTPEVFAAQASDAAQRRQWIIDGNYAAGFGERASRADLIIFVDAPTVLRLARVIQRARRHKGKTRSDLAAGCPERLNLHFLWYTASWNALKRRKQFRKLAAANVSDRVVRLRTAPLDLMITAVDTHLRRQEGSRGSAATA